MDPNRNKLAREARVLYMLAENMQNIMLEMFFEEFIEIDEEEKRMARQEDLPF